MTELLTMGEVTIKDIAEYTGVSYATVSRTLNNLSGVNQATREKILAAASEMGYRPNIHARSLKTNKTYTIALIVPDISNPFFADIALSVNDYAFERGYTTVLCSTNWNLEIEAKQIEQLENQRVDGIIYKPAGKNSLDLSNMPIPSVLISCMPGENSTYIEVDNYRGGQIAADHLLECGYRHFAFIGGNRQSQSNQIRIDGFYDRLKELHQDIRDERILYGDFTVDSGYRMAGRLMSDSDKPDAIFCGNDVIALGVQQYLLEHNYLIPEEVGLVGFDDIMIAGLPQIQLTTIAQPRLLMGKTAAEILLRRIDGEEIENKHIILKPELVTRRSTRK